MYDIGKSRALQIHSAIISLFFFWTQQRQLSSPSVSFAIKKFFVAINKYWITIYDSLSLAELQCRDPLALLHAQTLTSALLLEWLTFDLKKPALKKFSGMRVRLHFLCFWVSPPFFAPCTSSKQHPWLLGAEAELRTVLVWSWAPLTWSCLPKFTGKRSKMNKLGVACVLFLIMSFFNPALAITGTLGLEGGAIAIVLVLLATLIAVGIGLGTCIYKNDLCSCGRPSYNQVWTR